MFWKINYCKIGDNQKFYKIVNLQLETQKQVVNWFYQQRISNIYNPTSLEHNRKYCKSLYRYNFRVLGVVNLSSNGYKQFHRLGFKSSNLE